MKPDYWHNRWTEKKIGFHQDQTNPLLVKHYSLLESEEGDHIFVPLCGKTLDISWLLQKGHQVTGCELNESAVIELFEELGVKPVVSTVGDHKCYEEGRLRVWVGDFFQLTAKQIGKIDFVYDRAAFVALPPEMREKYYRHLLSVSNQSPQLLISICYEEGIADGPPFRITEQMVHDAYQTHFELSKLSDQFYEDGLKGKDPLTETAWFLSEKGPSVE